MRNCGVSAKAKLATIRMEILFGTLTGKRRHSPMTKMTVAAVSLREVADE
jgi:hypothetical protein